MGRRSRQDRPVTGSRSRPRRESDDPFSSPNDRGRGRRGRSGTKSCRRRNTSELVLLICGIANLIILVLMAVVLVGSLSSGSMGAKPAILLGGTVLFWCRALTGVGAGVMGVAARNAPKVAASIGLIMNSL